MQWYAKRFFAGKLLRIFLYCTSMIICMKLELLFCDLNSRLMNVRDTRFYCMKSRQNTYNKWTVEAEEEKTQSTVVRSSKCFFITLVLSTVSSLFHSCYAVPSYSFTNIAFYLVFVHVGFSDYTHDTLPRLWKSTLGYVSKCPRQRKIKEIISTKQIILNTI